MNYNFKDMTLKEIQDLASAAQHEYEKRMETAQAEEWAELVNVIKKYCKRWGSIDVFTNSIDEFMNYDEEGEISEYTP